MEFQEFKDNTKVSADYIKLYILNDNEGCFESQLIVIS